jgi:hypothetical protein
VEDHRVRIAGREVAEVELLREVPTVGAGDDRVGDPAEVDHLETGGPREIADVDERDDVRVLAEEGRERPPLSLARFARFARPRQRDGEVERGHRERERDEEEGGEPTRPLS